VVGGVGLREVLVWSAVERVDVRCRFEAGPVEEVRFEGLQGWVLIYPVQSVAQVKAENQRCPMFDRRTRQLPATICLLGSFSSFVCLAHR
jgi:hypothetical protein